MSGFVELLNAVPLAGLMLVVTLGFTLGRLAWRGLSLGPAGGTMLVALLSGAAGVRAVEHVGFFGFTLFIYSVGFEAGPRFFASLRGGRGWRFVVVGVVVNVVALGVALLCGAVWDLGPASTAGMLAGALTSAPTYAAAADITADAAELAVVFAITYPLGLAGVVVAVQFLPRLLRQDLGHGTVDDDADEAADRPAAIPVLTRAFDVQDAAVIGRSLAELELTARTGCWITQIHRGPDVGIPNADTRLERGDHVMAKGQLDNLHALEKLLGPEVYDEELRARLPSPRAVHVSEPAAIGKSLQELDLIRRHRVLVARVVRGGVVLEPNAGFELARDDIVHVAGSRDDVRAVARRLGRFERSTNETDIAVYAGGILLGLLLGRARIGGFGLGTAGGLLLVGVVLGRFRRLGPFSAHVPTAARQLVRDLGILLFVADAGLLAGASPFENLHQVGPLVAGTLLATVLPIAAAVVLGSRFLRLRAVDSWGSVAGGMTSSAALTTIRRAADSNEPAISYAAAYAVASVLAALAGQVVVMALR